MEQGDNSLLITVKINLRLYLKLAKFHYFAKVTNAKKIIKNLPRTQPKEQIYQIIIFCTPLS